MKTIEQIIESQRAKADRKHGDNEYGKFLFWSNMALRAFPSSPMQRAFHAEAEKHRSVNRQCS